MHPFGQQQNKAMTHTFKPIAGYSIDLNLLSYKMLSQWFVMMHIHGIFSPTSTPKQQYSTKFICNCKKSAIRWKQEPPNLIRRHIYFLLFVISSMTVEVTTNLVRMEMLQMSSLATIPLTLATIATASPLKRTNMDEKDTSHPTPPHEQYERFSNHNTGHLQQTRSSKTNTGKPGTAVFLVCNAGRWRMRTPNHAL